ncbi:MAG: GNAT family N-acetyltransferase [Breznakia sp.]
MIAYRKETDISSIRELCMQTHPQREEGFLKFYFAHLYEQGTGLIIKENERIISSLQLHEHVVAFHHKQLLCSYISGVSTHPDFRKQGHMNELLHSALDMSETNYLLTFIEAYNPKLYKKYGFEVVSYRKKYSVSQKEIKIKNTSGVQEEVDVADLVALYKDFSTRFDCYYKRDIVYYQDYMDSIEMNKGVLIGYYEESQLRGYCVYYESEERVEVSEIIYLDAKVMLKLLRYAIGYMPFISFEVSINERVEKIFKMSIPRKHTCVMARINNYTLFNKLYSCKVKTVEEAFALLQKPTLMNEKY